jgi:hypothetical protein
MINRFRKWEFTNEADKKYFLSFKEWFSKRNMGIKYCWDMLFNRPVIIVTVNLWTNQKHHIIEYYEPVYEGWLLMLETLKEHYE